MSVREELVLGVPGDASDPGAAARAFRFPYPEAYAIQLELMRKVFETIEHGQVGLFESPTGTGKSLSLICAAFTWLRHDAERAVRGARPTTPGANHGPHSPQEEPDWVNQHQIDKVRRTAEMHTRDLKHRIAAARAMQLKLKDDYRSGKLDLQSHAKRNRDTSENQTEDSDEDLLVDDHADTVRSTLLKASYSKKALAESGQASIDSNLSAEVRALMQQYEETKAARDRPEEDEEPETLPRIIYANRTHSQLSQFVAELKKTSFGNLQHVEAGWDEAEGEQPVRTISLGSRKQMCINEKVQKLGQAKGAEAMNERCLELMKANKSDQKRCPSLPPFDQAGRAQILEFRDNALGQIGDIEDLVRLGKSTGTCPYFAARSSAKQAELVTLPYNLLLQKEARQSLGISLKGCVVLIDEAHNLIDTILSSHSVTITSRQIEQAAIQIQTYLDRFALRLKGANEQNLRRMRAFLTGIKTFIQKWAEDMSRDRPSKQPIEQIVNANDFVLSIGGSLDQINLVTLEAWLKDTQIARKVSGYADKQNRKQHAAAAEPVPPKRLKGPKGRTVARTNHMPTDRETEIGSGGPTSASPISAMHSIESFLLSLANRTEDGRVLLSLQDGEKDLVQIKYQLLNPSHVFRQLVDEARSVIMVGGTMEPLSDFRQQLLPFIGADRLVSFSCGHVIPPNNLMVSVLCSSPKGLPFEFKYDSRDNHDLLDELGRTLVNLCATVPDGLVVFLPSYAFLDTVFKRWNDSASGTIMQRLSARKKVFSEPKSSTEVEKVLHEYAAAIDSTKSTLSRTGAGAASLAGGGSGGGAILFAVVGAKLSEGINFSDGLARGVVMVGMPFANIQSPELAERMKYVRELAKQHKANDAPNKADAGNELYINLCMKAVNQSIGRAVRHQNDYAALILLDRRYSRADIRARLPGWIRKQVTVADRFGTTLQQTAAFFKSKKET